MQRPPRFVTLDVMRGLTVAAMILVNNPGSWQHIYPPFKHAQWHGCTPTDLIFPFFLIIVGIAASFSFEKFNHTLSKTAALKVLKRSLLIFIIGLFLHAFPFYDTDYSRLRIMGVLQRIGIAYGFAALIALALDKRHLPLIIISILVFYWGLFLFFGDPVATSQRDNFHRQFDIWILGANHLWQGFGFPFDPEGLVSTLPAVASVLIGYMIGLHLVDAPTKRTVVGHLIVFGIMSTVIGGLWGMTFPINKSLWTSSYVLYSAGWAALTLACLIWLIDIKGFKKWSKPAIVFGRNPLFLYVIAWILSVAIEGIIQFDSADRSISLKDWFYRNLFSKFFGDFNGSLLFAILFVVIIWLCGFFMHKRKIYIGL